MYVILMNDPFLKIINAYNKLFVRIFNKEIDLFHVYTHISP